MSGETRPMRLVVFGPSLVADVDNPAATSTRALLGALTAAGHAVTHLEIRGNSLLDRQLRIHGSRALRALNERYPEVRVRQYDLPPGRQGTVWFGTEVSTADAVVALPGTPNQILALIAPFETPHLVRVVPAGAEGDLDLDLGAGGPMVCVERRPASSERTGTLAVAYDNITPDRVRGIPEAVDRTLVGDSGLTGWRYLPEVEVAERYRSARAAIVLDGDPRPEGLARVLLPLAAGCRVVTTRRLAAGVAIEGLVSVSREEIMTAVAEAMDGEPPPLPEGYDAAVAAAGLVARVRETLVSKRARDAEARPRR